MKIVIDIPEDIYRKALDGNFNVTVFNDAVRKSTPLSKGHKIIDATSLQEHLALVPMEDRAFRETVDIIDWFPSITETDKE